MYEILKNICKYDKITINKAETDMGFGKGYLAKIDSHKPSAERIQIISEYFKIPQSVLLNERAPATMTFNDVFRLSERTGLSARKLAGFFFNDDDVNPNERLLDYYNDHLYEIEDDIDNNTKCDYILNTEDGGSITVEVDKKTKSFDQTEQALLLYTSLRPDERKRVIEYMEFLKFKR